MSSETKALMHLIHTFGKSLGGVFVRLRESMTPDGQLDPEQLRYLDDVLADMRTIVQRHPDFHDGHRVVDGFITDSPVDAGVPPHRLAHRPGIEPPPRNDGQRHPAPHNEGR